MRLEQITARALERLDYDKYLLADVVAKRAKEISQGAKPHVAMDPNKFKHVDIALNEVADGFVTIEDKN